MRLKHFLEHVAKLKGWRLETRDDDQQCLIRRYEGNACECPLTAVGRLAIPCNNLDMSVACYKSIALCLNIPTAIAAASDNILAHYPNAPENVIELRDRLLKAARLA